MSEPVEQLTDQEEIALWWFDWFVELTHDVKESQELVMLGIAPRDLEYLLGRGCDMATAREILKPV